MEIDEFIDILKNFNACNESITWASSQQNAEMAWKNCQRGDWLLIYLKYIKSSKYDTIKAECDKIVLEANGNYETHDMNKTIESWDSLLFNSYSENAVKNLKKCADLIRQYFPDLP